MKLTLAHVGCVEDFHLRVGAPCRAHHKKMAEPSRTPPFLPECDYGRTKVVRGVAASERPSIGPVARVAMSLRA